ncbi:MAG: type 1 glutamine amidotransferase domain-containing protein [Cyanobacteria bacterium P01_H01_bin.21]
MAAPKILIITTSHTHLGNTEKKTGLWLEELTTPYYAFVDAGASVTVASIKGGPVPIDPGSEKAAGENSPSVERFRTDTGAQTAVANTPSINDVDANSYDAVFLPGGHGTMWDFPQSDRLGQIVAETLAQDRIVAAVCHGPAGLVSAKTATGDSVVKGRKVATFTDAEESAVGLTETVPFLLESKLRELGADIHTAGNFEAYAIADGNLITGQNPMSSELVAQKVLSAISASVIA